MEYKDERSEDLRLHLFRGQLELDAFPVIERRRRLMGGFAVDASIIGASHAVQVGVGGETVTEVLACRVAAVGLFADRLARVCRIDETARVRSIPGLGYDFSCVVKPLEQARDVLAEFRELVKSADRSGAVGLAFTFPQRTLHTPETLLHVSADEAELTIRSMHVYPGEDVAVVSESSLIVVAVTGVEAAPQLMEVGAR